MTAARVAAIIQRAGQTVILRRLTGTQLIPFDVEVKASIRGYQPHELVGKIQQGDREVIIANAEILARQWPGPPEQDDAVVIDGVDTSIEAVETRRYRDEVALHVLRVRG